MTAKTKANNKFSKSSKRIRFSPGQSTRKWFNPAYRPTPVTNRNLASVLASSGGKVTNMQGVRRGVRTSSLSAMRAGAMSANTARYTLNVNGAVAFAQLDGASTSGSGLFAISATGVVTDAFTENWTPEVPQNQPPMPPGVGAARVSKFHVDPKSGQIYIQFSGSIIMVQGGQSCMFYKFDPDTGLPTCVDPGLTGMHWFGGFMQQRYTNPGVQFDSAGNVYYMGYSYTMGSGGAVLRKYNVSTGQITDLINPNAMIQDFAVMPDGSVILVGGTTSTTAQWTRIVGPTGALRSLGGPFSATAANFITRFSDGNYYLGSWVPSGNGGHGVVRLNASTGQLDPKYWTQSPTWNDRGTQTNNSYMAAEFNGVCTNADGQMNYSDQFCQFGGAVVSKVVTANGADYVLNGGMGMQTSTASLMQYYPTLKRVPSNIAKVTLVESTGTKLILTGTNSQGQNIVSVYDPATNQETIVMDGSNEIEIYSMTYVPALGKMMFSGLQFSNNSYVVGEIAIP